jgi:hypothetical protein
VSEDQELIPSERHPEDQEPLPQSGLEEVEAISERALVPLQMSRIDFYGDGLLVVLVEIDGERQVLVPLRQFCQYLGVDWASQYQRTKRDEILAREMMSVVIITTLMPVRGQSEERVKAVCEEIRQAVLLLHNQGIYPGAKQVSLLLKNRHSVRSIEGHEAWRLMLAELGYPTDALKRYA